MSNRKEEAVNTPKEGKGGADSTTIHPLRSLEVAYVRFDWLPKTRVHRKRFSTNNYADI